MMKMEAPSVLLSIWGRAQMEMIAKRECTCVAKRVAKRSTRLFLRTRRVD